MVTDEGNSSISLEEIGAIVLELNLQNYRLRRALQQLQEKNRQLEEMMNQQADQAKED